MSVVVRPDASTQPGQDPRPTLIHKLKRRFDKRTRLTNGERLAYIVLAIAIAIPIMTSQSGLYTPDIKIEVYLNPWHRLALDLGTWLPDPQAGGGNYNLGLAPVDFAVAIFRSLGASPDLAVRTTKLVLVLLGAWGAIRLLRDLKSDSTPVMRFTFAAIYVANPYAIVAGSTLAIQLPYALFPWFLLAVSRAIRFGGWRWPAAAGICFFLMSGMNTAAIPVLQLVSVPALIGWTAWSWRVPLRSWFMACLRIVLLMTLVSVYWFVPALFALGAASNVVNNSETLPAINAVSSFSEVIRGLGMWMMYGSSATSGAWQPGFAPYLENPFVVLASFSLPIMAIIGLILSRSSLRILALGMTLSAAVVMVGLYPYDAQTPFGRLLATFLNDFPGALALRTTNKAGAGLALGIALLVALAASAIAERLHTPSTRVLASVVAIVFVALAVQPAVVGQLYPNRWDIPDYWSGVSAQLENGDPSRSWWVPGQVLARYQFSTDSVDDFPFSLLDHRPSMLRTTLPTESAYSTNFLAAVDSDLQDGHANPNEISSAAWYLGASNVFLRNDVNWQAYQGGRPAAIQPQLDQDRGLLQTATLGSPGQNVFDSKEGINPLSTYERRTQPLHFYNVTQPGQIVRTEDPGRATVIDGDGFAFNWLSQLGFLSGNRPFRYAGDLDLSGLQTQLGAGHELVITDSNQRRDVDAHRLTDSFGPVKSEAEPLGDSRTLFTGDLSKQTTLGWDGAVSVVPTELNGTPDPTASVARAFDGDPNTQWSISNGFSGSGVNSVTVTLPSPRPIGKIAVKLNEPGLFGQQPGRGISQIVVEANGLTESTPVPSTGAASVDLHGTVTDKLTIRFNRSATAENLNAAVSELTIDGAPIRPTLKTPLTVFNLVKALPASATDSLNRTPISVLLTRGIQSSANGSQEEPGISRDVAYPLPRSLKFVGIARGKARLNAKGCAEIGTIDGQPMLAKPVGGKTSEAGWIFSSCNDADFRDGQNQIRPISGVKADVIAFRDPLSEVTQLAGPMPAATVTQNSATGTVVEFGASGTPYYGVVSQNWTAGWRATVDGQPVNPIVLDGHAAAFLLAPGLGHKLALEYHPESLVAPSRWVSILTLIGCLILVLAVGPIRRSVRLMGSSLAVREVPTASKRSPETLPTKKWFIGVACTIGALVFGGWTVGAASAILIAVVLISGLRPRTILAISASLLTVVPFLWLAGASKYWGTVSPVSVINNPYPSIVTAVALTVATLGLWLEYRQRRGDR